MGRTRQGSSAASSASRTAREPPRGFDFTSRIRQLCVDLAARLPQLRHVDVQRVAVSFAQTRKPVPHGLYATLTPMRFEDGSLTTTRRGRTYTVQRLFDSHGREMLYILCFYLPRFMDLPFEEKLVTIFHELWHISPDFNGDLRRHSGRCYAHTHSQAQYDRHMAELADRYLALAPPEELYSFLRLSFAELHGQFGRVYGTRISHPKLICVDAE